MTNRGIPSRFERELAPPGALFSRISAAVQATPASSTGTGRRLALALAIIPFLIAAVVVIANLAVYPLTPPGVAGALRAPLHFATALAGFAALTALATFVAVRPGSRGLGSEVTALSIAAVLVAPIFTLLTVSSPLETGHTLAQVSPWGLRCMSVAAVVGVLVLASFAAAMRRAAPVASRLRGAALGAAAGAWAGCGLFFFCPGGDLRHLLVGHVPPVVAFTLLGAWLLPRALRP